MTPTCDAHTIHRRIRASGFGDEGIPCRTSVGLRSFVDRAGVTRRHCSVEGHRRQVERLYGVADPVEPEWLDDPIDQYKSYHDWQAAGPR